MTKTMLPIYASLTIGLSIFPIATPASTINAGIASNTIDRNVNSMRIAGTTTSGQPGSKNKGYYKGKKKGHYKQNYRRDVPARPDSTPGEPDIIFVPPPDDAPNLEPRPETPGPSPRVPDVPGEHPNPLEPIVLPNPENPYSIDVPPPSDVPDPPKG